MRRALVFGKNLSSQTLSRSTRLSSLVLNKSLNRHYVSYFLNNHSHTRLSHADNGHFPELSLKDFMEEMNQPEERRLLDDAAFTPAWAISIESDKDLEIVLKTACRKCECVKQAYCSNEDDSVFKLNLGRAFHALRIFNDIFEYSTSHSTSTAQNIKKLALEYLNEFQKDLKKLMTPEDQKREYYLKVQDAITKFLQKETPQDSPSP